MTQERERKKETIDPEVLKGAKQEFEAVKMKSAPIESAGEIEKWGLPGKLKKTLRPVDQLDTNILPEPIRTYCTDRASGMKIQVDYLVIAVTVMLSSLIGTGCGIRPKKLADWLVVPNTWGAIIGPPGWLKSPALEQPLKLLDRVERRASEQFDDEIKTWEFEKKVFDASKADLDGQLKEATSGKSKPGKVVSISRDAAIEAIKASFIALDEPAKPTRRRFKTNDASPEKTAEMLRENQRGIMLFRDEVMGWTATLDREDRQSERKFWLETWNGTGQYTQDRIGRGTIEVPNMCVSVLGGIQPAKLCRYLFQAVGSFSNDGLIQRFQLMVYPDAVDWEYVDLPPNLEAEQALFDTMLFLADTDFAYHCARTREQLPVAGTRKEIPYLQFDEYGQEVFKAWLTDLETKLRCDDESDVLKEHLSKYRSLMPSLALIFHLCEQANARGESGMSIGLVPAKQAHAAVKFCSYLESHARRIYGLVTDGGDMAAQALAEKLEEGALNNGFTAYGVRRNCWSGLTDAPLIEAALQRLVEANWLRAEKVSATEKPGRPTVRYQINPVLLEANYST